MITTTQKKLITAREAEAYIPPLEKFAGNFDIKEKLLRWLQRPIEQDANLLIEGGPGTGKTAIIHAYLREQFKNPGLFQEAFLDKGALSHYIKTSGSIEEIREWQCGGRYFFTQINGATDTENKIRGKLEDLTMAKLGFLEERIATHMICVVDEVGELFFRGLEEALRPIMTEPGITTFATAQNFHSKRKTDSFKEEDQRRIALLRRFTHREKTQPPTKKEHFSFLLFLISEWNLKIDEEKTLHLLVEKADGVVGLSKRILVQAIDAPGRRLTHDIVYNADVDLI